LSTNTFLVWGEWWKNLLKQPKQLDVADSASLYWQDADPYLNITLITNVWTPKTKLLYENNIIDLFKCFENIVRPS